MISHLLSFLTIITGISFGILLGHLVDPSWIRPFSRAFWRLMHRKGCPFPLKPLRKEHLKDYRFTSPVFGCDFHVDVFDIRGMCIRCGRVHRVEMKIYNQINPLP